MIFGGDMDSKKYIKIFVAGSLVIYMSGCATKMWPFNSGKSDAHSQSDEESLAKTSRKSTPTADQINLELKQAQAWNRMNELEDEVRVQREKIKLLEQGLLTGIAPEELKTTKKSKKHKGEATKNEKEDSDLEQDHAEVPPPVLDLPQKLQSTTSEDKVESTPGSYRVRVQVAKDYIQASRYGMAVAELANIQKDFGPKAGDGEAQFLMGQAYLGLKEYSISRQEFEGFLKAYPKHGLEPNVRLELARAYRGLNLRDRSRSELSYVAKEFKGTEEADIAANEIQKMKGSL